MKARELYLYRTIPLTTYRGAPAEALRVWTWSKARVALATRWERAHARGLVRVLLIPDPDGSPIDATWWKEWAEEPGANLRAIKKAEKAERATLETYGAWGIVSQYRATDSEPWEEPEDGACWGFLFGADGPTTEYGGLGSPADLPFGASYGEAVDVLASLTRPYGSEVYGFALAALEELEAEQDRLAAARLQEQARGEALEVVLGAAEKWACEMDGTCLEPSAATILEAVRALEGGEA